MSYPEGRDEGIAGTFLRFGHGILLNSGADGTRSAFCVRDPAAAHVQYIFCSFSDGTAEPADLHVRQGDGTKCSRYGNGRCGCGYESGFWFSGGERTAAGVFLWDGDLFCESGFIWDVV